MAKAFGSTMTRQDFLGVEFDWYAVDLDEHVALLSSNGTGIIPDIVLAHLVEIELIDDAYLERIDRHDPKRVAPGSVDEWWRMAQKGFYAYDAEPNTGPYVLRARPDRPVRVSDLEESVARAISPVRLNVKFSECATLNSNDLGIPE